MADSLERKIVKTLLAQAAINVQNYKFFIQILATLKIKEDDPIFSTLVKDMEEANDKFMVEMTGSVDLLLKDGND